MTRWPDPLAGRGGQGLREEGPCGQERSSVSWLVVGDSRDRARDGVLMGEPMHGTAVHDELPVSPGIVHLRREPRHLGHPHMPPPPPMPAPHPPLHPPPPPDPP